MTKSLVRIAAIFAVLLAAEVGRGQAIPRAQAVAPGQPAPYGQPGYGAPGGYGERMAVVDPDKKLSAGDQITVEIVEDKEGGLPRIVTATGDLDVFPLGRVHVGGKTTTEACSDIKRKLEADYYYHATVRISIDAVSRVQVKAGTVYLSGELRQIGPQEMVAGETLTLSNAVLKAGGGTEWANLKKVKVTRKVAGGSTQTNEYDVKSIIDKGDINNDPVLQDGDRINVPKIFFRTN